MKNVKTLPRRRYRYIESVFQFSGGVAALPGFGIERAMFAQPLPIADAFAAIESHLGAIGRPSTALCACELRSPAQFSDREFVDFNKVYVQNLERFGLFRDGVNPVARTNVVPQTSKPATPSIYAFCYTVPSDAPTPALWRPAGPRRQKVEATTSTVSSHSTTSVSADCRDKLRFVRDEQALRLDALGLAGTTRSTSAATAWRTSARCCGKSFCEKASGVTESTGTTPARPLQDCVFEMDARTVLRDITLP